MPRSYRLQFKFWLDIAKPLEKSLAEDCENLKERRGFQTAVRDGLRLLLSLRRGETEVLLELFPWVADAFSRDNRGDGNGSGHLDYHTIDAAARAIVERAEGLIMASAGNVPKALNMPKPLDGALPEIEVREAKPDAGNNPAFNMLLASVGMGICSLDDLPPEVQAYALAQDFKPPKPSRKPALRVKSTKPAKTPPAPVQVPPDTIGTGGPKPLAGAAIEFAVPAFDDLPMEF